MATFDEGKEWRRQLDSMAREVKQVVAVVLNAAGYHQHARGTWRKRRERPVSAEATRAMEALAATARTSEGAARHYFDGLAAIDPANAAATTDLLIRLHEGDPVQTHEARLLQRIEPSDHLRREAIRRRVMQIRSDLEGPEPVSVVERIIIDRVLIGWLAVQEAEGRIIRAGDSGSVFLLKRLDHAQKRMVDMVKALDLIRRKTPASHRLSFNVLGDLHLGGAVPSPQVPPAIDVTPSLTEGPDHAP